MTKFDDTNSSFVNVADKNSSSHPRLLEDAMGSYSSLGLKAVGTQIGKEIGNAYQNQPHSLELHHMSIYGVAKDGATQDDVAKGGATQDGAFKDGAATNGVAKDGVVGAGGGHQYGALKSDVSQIDPGIHKLNTDVMASTIAGFLEKQWVDAKAYGSLDAAAELQKFADSASRGSENEVLSKIYKDLNPQVAEKLKQAIRSHDTIDFDS